MNLVPWKNKQKESGETVGGFAPLVRLRDEMDHVFDRFMRDPWSGLNDLFGRTGSWVPAMEITENENEIMVEAELPGIDPRELDIHVSGNVLTLSGEKTDTREEKRKGAVYTERRFGSFQRSLQLPGEVDAERISADYEKGVLKIRMPRLESAKPRRIPVRTQ